VAGLALLPWEQWLARLFHFVSGAIKLWSYEHRRNLDLARTESWPKTEGTVHRVTPDFSYPREQIDYCYSTEQGYHAGSYWHWFDQTNPGQIRIDDAIVLRYDPDDHEQSVFLRTAAEPNPLAIPSNLRCSRGWR
jgi:hypothetical protein